MSKRVFTGFSCPKEMQDWIYAEAQRQNRSASNLIQTILLKEKERLERIEKENAHDREGKD